MVRPRKFAVPAVVLMLISVLAACGGGGGGGGGSGDGGPPEPGGIYRTTSSADTPSLDPQKESSYKVQGAVSLVYSKLVDFKTGKDIPYGSRELEGELAESWEQSPDGMTWTFHLRQGVKFQDIAPVNGREFTSADVDCTLKRIKSLPGIQTGHIAQVASWATPDPYTVVFSMTEPFPDFILNLAGHFMWMLPCEATEGKYDMEKTAIGTGPFILDSWDKDVERVYVKNPDYWDAPRPYLDGVTISIVPDQAATISALRTEKIDVAGFSDNEQIKTVTKSNPDMQVENILSFSSPYIYMNQDRAPFDDVRVRQAVQLAIDRENMYKALRPGGDDAGELAGPLGPKVDGGLTPEESAELQPYDPDKAKDLLAEAGYPDGFETNMIVTDGYGATVVSEAQWVQQDLADIGITVNLDVQDYASYFTESFAKEQYDMGFGLQSPYLTGDELFQTNFSSDGTRNWYNIADPTLDSMIDDARGILDDDARLKAIHDIQVYILENVANPVNLYVYNTTYLMQPWVHDWYPDPTYGQRWLKYVQLGADAPGREE